MFTLKVYLFLGVFTAAGHMLWLYRDDVYKRFIDTIEHKTTRLQHHLLTFAVALAFWPLIVIGFTLCLLLASEPDFPDE